MKLTIVQFGGKMIANDLRKRAKFFENIRVVHLPADSPKRQEKYKLGDVSVTLIKTTRGQSIYVTHDTNLPRPYSRKYVLQGTRGLVEGYPRRVYVEGLSAKEDAWDPAEKWFRAPRGDRWEIGTMMRVGAVSPDAEAVGVDPAAGQLQARAPGDVAGHQPEDDPRGRLEGLEQPDHTRQDGGVPGARELFIEVIDVPLAHILDDVRIARVGVPARGEEFHDDQGVGLPVEADLQRLVGEGEMLGDGAGHRPAPRTGGEEDGPIDVEEDKATSHSAEPSPRG